MQLLVASNFSTMREVVWFELWAQWKDVKNKQFPPNLKHWVLKFGGQKQENYFQPFFKFLTPALKFYNGHKLKKFLFS
jgi:hypothetical protein